jgi:hypothetical protein
LPKRTERGSARRYGLRVAVVANATLCVPTGPLVELVVRPGFGADLDEKLAAKFPIDDDPPFDMRWGNVRRGDGTVVKP